MAQRVVISTQIQQSLTEAVGRVPHDKLFILTDETTQRLCFPVVADLPCLKDVNHIVIPTTDTHKTLDTLAQVWTELGNKGGTRHSLMICLGGGMVTDLGGFAASTFKRGIPYINIPTTLLSMVDASVGGKTGINFNGLKNEIGVFNEADTVILDTIFLRTLDTENLLSGFAEMLKHGLISNRKHLAELLQCPIGSKSFTVENSNLHELISCTVSIKESIVAKDPHEQGLRKALNLGHTVGHAFESFMLSHSEGSSSPSSEGDQRKGSPFLHGYAVAFGMVCELYLSCVKCGFPTETMRQVVQFIREHYGTLSYTCDDYPTLYELMTHDKKNTADSINFTLLADVGELRLNQTATREEIYEALDFLREGL